MWKRINFLRLRNCASILRYLNRRSIFFLGKGLIPAAKVGRQWRFNKESIDKWMADEEKYYTERKDRRTRDIASK